MVFRSSLLYCLLIERVDRRWRLRGFWSHVFSESFHASTPSFPPTQVSEPFNHSAIYQICGRDKTQVYPSAHYRNSVDRMRNGIASFTSMTLRCHGSKVRGASTICPYVWYGKEERERSVVISLSKIHHAFHFFEIWRCFESVFGDSKHIAIMGFGIEDLSDGVVKKDRILLSTYRFRH